MNPDDPSKDTPDSRQPAPSPEPERPLYHDDDAAAAPPADNQQYDYAEPLPASPAPQSHPDHNGTVEWTASEFIAHDKDTSWFAGLAGATAGVALIVYLITRDFFSVVVVCIAGVLFGVAAKRPPRELHYVVDDHGVAIGPKTYPYADFRSFSVLHEGPLKSITFMPLKRFMPPISMYYDPADEDKIAMVLAAHLPMQDHPNDPIDNLMKKIRF